MIGEAARRQTLLEEVPPIDEGTGTQDVPTRIGDEEHVFLGSEAVVRDGDIEACSALATIEIVDDTTTSSLSSTLPGRPGEEMVSTRAHRRVACEIEEPPALGEINHRSRRRGGSAHDPEPTSLVQERIVKINP